MDTGVWRSFPSPGLLWKKVFNSALVSLVCELMSVPAPFLLSCWICLSQTSGGLRILWTSLGEDGYGLILSGVLKAFCGPLVDMELWTLKMDPYRACLALPKGGGHFSPAVL